MALRFDGDAAAVHTRSELDPFAGFDEDNTERFAPRDTSKTPRLKPPPVPKKALRYSLILPGAGQIYNGRWWKTPFVYGAIGGALSVAIFNQRNFTEFQNAYVLKLRNEPHRFSNTILDDARRLRIWRDRYDKNRQTWYILTVAAYGLQAVEALVDAHLQNFDVNEDLSLRLRPTLGVSAPGGMAPGIALTLQIK